MDPHLHGQQPDAFDERERLFSGQRGRGGVLRPSQAGVLPQAQLRGRLDGRVHQHAQRLHGLVPGQADQDGVRHEHHGSSTRARSCGMIGGDGINDESNKTAPAPKRNADLTKDTVVHRRNPYAVAHVHESADSFPSVRTGPLPHARRRAANVLGDVDATLPGDDASGGPGPDVKRIRGGERRPCRGSRAIQFVRHPSDGYPSSAITFFSVTHPRKHTSTAFRLCASPNTADSNPDTHASNFSSASPTSHQRCAAHHR